MAPVVSQAFRVQSVVSEEHCNCHAHPALTPRHPLTLPHEVSSFIGRREQIEAVAARLRTGRLVTLTGGGGIGKTRLALQVARKISSEYTACAWTALSSVGDGDRVSGAVAAALDGSEPASALTVQVLAACIRDRRLLLVLDNCEHLVAACAEVVFAVLQACPGVRVLATSREPLGVPGEAVFPVPPLGVSPTTEPADGEAMPTSEAVRLFVERARAREPRLNLTGESQALITRICQTVGGVPLAIELAAARTSSMSVAEIVDRLDDVLGLLALGSRTAPPRQRSLRGSLDWSYALLQEPERRLLRRLAVFDAQFTLEAADAVCAFDGLRSSDIALLVDRLVAQSLVQTSEQQATTCFSLSAAVHQYARERLEAASEVAPLQTLLENWRNNRSSHAVPVRDGATVPTGLRGERATATTAVSDADAVPSCATGTDEASGPHASSGGNKNESEPGSRQPRGRRPSLLSQRERDVVLLIAGGRSNREIADALVITKKTAEAHVSHILTKLGLCSRVQIATWSLQHGLAADVAAVAAPDRTPASVLADVRPVAPEQEGNDRHHDGYQEHEEHALRKAHDRGGDRGLHGATDRALGQRRYEAVLHG
jgi:predicted ATPase/DNA-binding CsgD family transcriptional regulator